MEALLFSFCRKMAVKGVGEEFEVGDDRIWRSLRHYVDEAREHADYSGVTSVGIDETSSRKGHNYITVVVDAKRRRTIYACAGRDKETIARFAEDLKSHGGDPEAVVMACIDMSPAFIAGVGAYLPNARIVYDKFHIVKLANDAVDEVRREEQKTRKLELRKTRYILLRNREDLSGTQTDTVAILARKRVKTGRA